MLLKYTAAADMQAGITLVFDKDTGTLSVRENDDEFTGIRLAEDVKAGDVLIVDTQTGIVAKNVSMLLADPISAEMLGRQQYAPNYSEVRAALKKMEFVWNATIKR